jgi:hypothetical protein
LHGAGIPLTTAESLLTLFSFIIFVNILIPVDVDILQFFVLFQQPGPVFSICLFLLDDELEVEAELAPLRGLHSNHKYLYVNLVVEFNLEFVVFVIGLAKERQTSRLQVYLLILDVSDFDGDI